MNDHDLNTDPKLDALLDEALGPVTAPADLTDAVFAATRRRIADRQPAVLARIGRTRRLRHLAAAIILVMEAGLFATILGIGRDAQALTSLEQDLRRLDRLAAAAAPLDAEVDILAADIELTRYEVGDWDAWNHTINHTLDEWHRQMDNEPIFGG